LRPTETVFISFGHSRNKAKIRELNIRAVPHFGSSSGWNPALFPNPAKIPPEQDSFAGFEKSIFPRH